jgi:hypothetical protein
MQTHQKLLKKWALVLGLFSSELVIVLTNNRIRIRCLGICIYLKFNNYYVGFEVLTTASMKMAGSKRRLVWHKFTSSSEVLVASIIGVVNASQTDSWLVAYSSPWWRKQQVPKKRWWTSTILHGAATQKTAIFNNNYCLHWSGLRDVKSKTVNKRLRCDALQWPRCQRKI